ncbi:MAG: hypothetical protein ACR2N2_02965 [Acidimicrobiia bacterium]
MSRDTYIDPIERLGVWDGSAFVPVTESSIDAPRVHIITHGWAPGLLDVVQGSDGFTRVWDAEAVTRSGKRFDRWFYPLADAICADDPDAAVVAYTWIDESATQDSMFDSARSQLRTTINGQRLSVALRRALASKDSMLHFIGYSHGAKVATVAATLTDPAPQHLTILDSPDNLLPVLGGALNDLSSYLRILAPGNLMDDVLIDNYSSHFGIHYGTHPGLGAVHDIELDPEGHPMDEAPTAHSYAWAWYLESAKHPERGVGYAWSPLRGGERPPHFQMHQQPSSEDPLVLEENPEVQPSTIATSVRMRMRERMDKSRFLSTDGSTRAYGLFWRRKGDLWATAKLEWHTGPDHATTTVRANRTERARSVRGWTDTPTRRLPVPLGGARAGPMFVVVELVSDEPASVSVGRATAVNGFTLPTGSEFQAWGRPLLWSAIAGTVVGLLLVARIPARRARRQRS